MKCRELMGLLREIADEGLASAWDNPGLLVGDREGEIKSVLIALDATDEVVDEAISLETDIIITHHPLIFKGIKRVTADDFTGRRIIKLIQNDISCFAMHTNFDVSCMGEEAALKLRLKNCEVLEETSEDEGFGRIGELREVLSVQELCTKVKDAFSIENVKVFGDLEREVKRAAIMPGSGSGSIDEAVKKGAEVLITGDIGHHDGLDAVEKGLVVIDAGPFGIERIFIDYIADYLKNNTKELEIFKDDREIPFRVV